MKIWFLIFCCQLALIPGQAQLKRFSFQAPKMGSLFSIVIYSNDSGAAANAAAHTYRLIDTLNDIFSDYLPHSELNRLCAKSGTREWVKVSDILFQVLQKACDAGRLSHGSFDITMGPLVRLWRTARREKKLPVKDSIHAARRLVNYRYIELEVQKGWVRLKKPGMQLDLGGIAKGETAHRAIERLKSLGFPFALLDAGGDIVTGLAPPGKPGWTVGINLPGSEALMNQQLSLQNQAVTTSGDLYQYIELDGKRYSHIVDPHTGYALTESRNVTVISRKGIDADWLTKACSILSRKKCMALVAQFPSTEVQIGLLQNGKPVFYRSKGFERYLR